MRIRQYEAADRDGARELCRRTARERPFTPVYEDPGLAPLLFLEQYLTYEPEACFVAEADGVVRGYIVGTSDTIRYRRYDTLYQRLWLPRLFGHWLGQTLQGRYRTLRCHRAVLRRVRDIIAGVSLAYEEAAQHVDLRRFPAHCHMQVAPDWRSARVGLALLLKFREYLRTLGVPGQHSAVVEQRGKESYSRLVQSLGGRLAYRRDFTRQDNPMLVSDDVWTMRLMVAHIDAPHPRQSQ